MTTAETRQRLNSDLIAGAVVATVGGALVIASLMIDRPARHSDLVGPTIFPLVASSILMVGGLVLATMSLRSRRSTTSEDPLLAPVTESSTTDASPAVDVASPQRLIVVLALFIGYAIAFEPLGFLVSTTIFMTAMTTFVARDKLRRNAVVAVSLAACVYYSFSNLLGVPLPSGILG